MSDCQLCDYAIIEFSALAVFSYTPTWMASSVSDQAASYEHRRPETISALMAAWNQIVNSWLVLFWPIDRFIMVSPSFSHLHFSFKDRLLTIAGA